MEGKKKKTVIFLCISIVLMLVSMIGSNLSLTSGNSVTMKQLNWETSEGYTMSADLFVPRGVSATHKAPAIVTSHGMYNDKEMQTANSIELSRRGYVVLDIDMFSHGDSQPVPNIGVLMSGAYEAVKYVSTLDYVNTSEIGIQGHSLGGMSMNVAVQEDNAAPKHLIAAMLYTASDPTYTPTNSTKFVNVYGNRDVAVIADKYDEFFMRGVNAAGQALPPRDFIQSTNAQSFLHFGANPKGLTTRSAGIVYHQNIDGKDAIRAIYTPLSIHPWAFYSSLSEADTINFFNAAFGAPHPIPATHQVWKVDTFFTALGLIGFAMFILSFAILMLYTQFFSTLREKEILKIRSTDAVGKIWFWGMAIVTTAFNALIFVPLMTHIPSFTVSKAPFAQSQSYSLGLWSVIAAAFIILTMLAYHFTYGKKVGFDLDKTGVSIPWKKLGKTIVLSLLVVVVSYAWVFFANYFFKTDFRYWLLGIPAFKSNVVLTSLFPYLEFFLVYYLVLSLATNSFNFVRIGNHEREAEWINTTILAIVNVLPIGIIILLQYIHFFSTGVLLINSAAMQIDWTFPFLVVIPVATVISRKLYRFTRNPYLPGIILGIMATLIVCSNSLTWS